MIRRGLLNRRAAVEFDGVTDELKTYGRDSSAPQVLGRPGTATVRIYAARLEVRSVLSQNRRVDAPEVSLLRWLRRQLREPTPIREHLEAAVANNDPAEARRLVAALPFSQAQRRNVEQLLDAWERRGR